MPHDETAPIESGVDVDAQAMRAALRHAVTGVTVVATEADDGIQAMTVGSFGSVSLSPPLVLFCAGRSTRLGLIAGSLDRFTVNVLGDDQEALSAWFAGMWEGPEPPPFAFMPWAGGQRLEGCVVSFACTVDALHEAGDHWIIVGRVAAVHQATELRGPLVFHGGKYARVEALAPGEVDPAAPPPRRE